MTVRKKLPLQQVQRILHIIPALGGGGAERQLSLLALEQMRKGIDVHVATRRGGHHEQAMRDHGVAIHYLGDLRYAHPLLFGRLWSVIKTINPDIVQTWLPQMDIVGGLVAKAAGKPWVLSERNSKKAFTRPPRSVWWLRRQIARLASLIVANSQAGYDYWLEHIGKSDRLATISNGLDLAGIRVAQPLGVPGAGPDGDNFLLVGRLLPHKSPQTLVRALDIVHQHYPARALIIGDGPLREELEGLIRDSGLADSVSVVPYQTEWWGHLKTAVALVSMSQYEGQPNVVLEAMAAGCPVIVSDIPMHREILDESTAVLVPVGDAAALADAMISLIAHRDEAHRRAELAQQSVARMNMDNVARNYELLYERALRLTLTG